MGRAWRAEELRLKSHGDLHKLWYVLLKEKNKLRSDFLMCKQMQQIFYGHSELTKVSLSMARLLTVVNERKRLRSEYRRYLENQYIAKKKSEEEQAFLEHREQLKAAGETALPMTPAEIREMLQARDEKKRDQLVQARETIEAELQDGASMAPGLG